MKNKRHPSFVLFFSAGKGITVLVFSLLLNCFFAGGIFAQNVQMIVNGKILDDKGAPLSGASIAEKGTNNATSSKRDGSFSLTLKNEKAVLVISFIGYVQQEVNVSANLIVRMAPLNQSMDSVVVVGYGRQRKQSVVGAISQTTGKVLERAGGVSSVGAALTGNVPGVITVQGTGMPGGEDPTIFIRGQGTWNSSSPLVLVDGIERSLGGLDISSVESISVLKDASATAVFGVKGANGVVLITTKRGVEGKANISITANSTAKIPSRLPQKYDAYDALTIRNWAIERELGLNPSSWADYTPQAKIEKYRYPANEQEAQQYPNIDWQEEAVKNFAMSNNFNLGVSGGSAFVKYYTAVDFLHEADIMRVRNNNKGYDPGFTYDRLNIRANLDFKLTGTTSLQANLAGLYGNKMDTWSGFEYTWYQSIYGLAPDLFYPQYSDGYWGYYPLDPVSTNNSSLVLANDGIRKTKTTQINTDFTLNQDMSMLLKNLNFKGTVALDNTFASQGGIYDDGSALTKWIAPDGRIQYGRTTGANQFDYTLPLWSTRADAMNNGATRRQLVYQLQLNHSAKFGRHNLTEMGMFQRNENATGSSFPNYREDWVFRTTYNFANRYFAEFNGAYNGSEKFSRDYRFDFFPSAAIGWTITNEKFMQNLHWLTTLKLRGSYGLVGNDAVNGRWLYLTQWSYGSQTHMGDRGNNNSPYVWYREQSVGNPDVHWETVEKANAGVDFSVLGGLFEGGVDLFRDYRYDILVPGGSRAVPVYFGATPPVANLGKTQVKGYELELKFNRRIGNKMRVWANTAMTHAKDKILERDDPQLLDDYQKQAGFQIGQYRSQIRAGFYNTWDQVYGSSIVNSYDKEKLPGNFNLIDFNGDGVINDYDNVPYAYPERPQNTYTGTLGFDFKRLTFFVQFYGVNNVTRNLLQTNFSASLNSVFKQGDYWTKDNTDATSYLPRWKTHVYSYGDFYNYDGSYLRLKAAEIGYTINPAALRKRGIQSMRVYLNGNNLLFWSKMPDDREANIGSANYAGQGAYPTVRRINLGLNLSL
ncbi:MAG: SusC/RagA family TonB-linked outer membrane protein [Candidatus Dadabacteria bacterium]